jgi:hypothetical protein
MKINLSCYASPVNNPVIAGVAKTRKPVVRFAGDPASNAG